MEHLDSMQVRKPLNHLNASARNLKISVLQNFWQPYLRIWIWMVKSTDAETSSKTSLTFQDLHFNSSV